ncbi:Uncharacterised protein [Nocardia brasiliensis]|nr:Uncharacterised protein [Nocardia brasiliensis]
MRSAPARQFIAFANLESFPVEQDVTGQAEEDSYPRKTQPCATSPKFHHET